MLSEDVLQQHAVHGSAILHIFITVLSVIAACELASVEPAASAEPELEPGPALAPVAGLWLALVLGPTTVLDQASALMPSSLELVLALELAAFGPSAAATIPPDRSRRLVVRLAGLPFGLARIAGRLLSVSGILLEYSPSESPC